MKAESILRTAVILIVLGSTIGCDQVSKSLARNKIEYNEEISLLSNYVTLTKVENSGAFLSLGNSLPGPVKFILLSLLPMLAVACGLVFLITRRNLHTMTQLGICLVLGGGVGNLYDRIVHGSVTDFMHIDFVLFQTGIFNMADVSIMTGILIILIESSIWRSKIKATQQ